MKKITAFFMALMPLLITVLLFAAGLIVKNATHVYVSSVELPNQNVQILRKDESVEKTYQLEANVLPKNATNPKIKWSASDDNVITVDANGLVTCKNFGEAYVYAVSDENPTLSSACKVDVYDTVIHSIDVSNKYQASYLGVDQTQKLNITTVPSMSHIVNQTIKYNVISGKEVLDVTRDGLILPKAKGRATIEITSDDPESKAINTFEVKVGDGVNTMCLDNPNNEVIANDSYNLFDHIVTAPEKIKRNVSIQDEESAITETDFIYSSSDETIAQVNEKGQVEFQLPGIATFTITYKRDPNLKVTKTIESTCNQLKQVYFSGTEFTVALDDDLNSKINWFVYPYSGDATKTKDVEGVEIISSNEEIVSVTPINGQPRLKILAPGSVTLTARIKTADDSYRSDSCLVKVLLPNDFVKESTVEIDSCYYPLINNIKIATDQQYKGLLKFEIDESTPDVASIENNILHFSNPQATAKIKVTAQVKPNEAEIIRTFDVKCNCPVTTLEVQDKLVIEVGKRYEFKAAWPIWRDGLIYKNYADYFDYDENDNHPFSAYKGGHFSQFQVITGGEVKNIDLTIVENPLYIASDSETYYSTSAKKIYFNGSLIFDKIQPYVYPSTATKEDGTKYSLSKEYYDPFGPATATVEDDIVYFNHAGTVFATATCEIDKTHYIYQAFALNSTFGDTVGKFVIKDTTGKSYNSYDTIKLDPAVKTTKSITLLSDQLDEYNYTGMTIESTTKLCLVENPKWVEGSNRAEITITAQPGKYGKDIVAIKTKTYTVYLNIEVEPVVTDFVMTRAGEYIDSTKLTKTYTTNLKFRLQTLPAAKTVKPSDISAKFNGKNEVVLTVGEDFTITLPSAENWKDGTQEADANIITISCQGVSKQYKLVYSKETPKFWLDGAVENNLYLTSNSTQKECKVMVDGLVDDNWYDNLKVSFASTELGEKWSFTRQYLTIYGISLPDVENYKPYENTLTLQLGESGPKVEYKMGRDYISKITFPGHDNDDMTDKKGLQKVHVYGNHSYYKEDMKEVDYYKLPVLLEDYNHKQIVNTEENPEAVLTAMKTLVATFGESTARCEPTNDGYIKIFFDKNDLYTFDELREDKFATANAKNVTFTLTTKSNEVKAQYTFVATEGVNQYCQEGLLASQNKQTSSINSVLQTNFGMPEGTKNNEPLTNREIDKIYSCIGNGYTIDFDNVAKQAYQSSQWFTPSTIRALNLIIKGQEKNTMLIENAHSEFGYIDDDSIKSIDFKYTTLMDFTHASNVTTRKYDVHFNKCLFRENLTGVFYQDGANQNKFYLEDCIFFDTASLILIGLKSNVYIKGFVDIYNFHGKECLKNIPGVGDLSALWPIVENVGRQKDMLNRGADGRSYVNTFSAVALFKTYFYNFATGQYEESDHGLPGSCEHLSQFVNLKIPGTDYNADFWATPNSVTHPGAPSYYDEFDKDGNVRLDFLFNQIIKITREVHYF